MKWRNFLRFTYYFYLDEHGINYHSPLSKQFDLILNVNIDVWVGVQYVGYYTYWNTIIIQSSSVNNIYLLYI